MTVHYSDDDLRATIRELESQLVERKRSAGDRSGIHRNICAFANDLAGYDQPGVVLIGIEDDGRCAGSTFGDEELRAVSQMSRDGSIQPMPSVSVEHRVIDGCQIVVVLVNPSTEPPVRYQGRAFVKVGPTVRPATAEEEMRLAERRRARDLPFDLRPVPGSTTDVLDLGYVRDQYLPVAIAPDVLEENRRPLPQQLQALRLAVGSAPTYGGVLGMARDPQAHVPGAWVQFLRIDGTDLTDPIRDQKSLTGRLEDVLRRLDELLELGISVRTDVAETDREQRRPDYPLAAMQQLVRNAVMHRAYEGTNAPIRVTWYSDRIEIQSPGGLYGQVTPGNFGQGVTDYRNPLVAEIMHNLGFAQRFGLGIPLARAALESNGNPEPDFRFEPTLVLVTVRAAL